MLSTLDIDYNYSIDGNPFDSHRSAIGVILATSKTDNHIFKIKSGLNSGHCEGRQTRSSRTTALIRRRDFSTVPVPTCQPFPKHSVRVLAATPSNISFSTFANYREKKNETTSIFRSRRVTVGFVLLPCAQHSAGQEVCLPC